MHLRALVTFIVVARSAYAVDRLANSWRGSGRNKSDKKSDVVEVTPTELADLIADQEYALTLFCDGRTVRCDKWLGLIESLDLEANKAVCSGVVLARVMDGGGVATEYGITKLPTVALFDDGVPDVFDGDESVGELALRQWLVQEIRSDDVEVVDGKVLRNLARRTSSLLAVFTIEESWESASTTVDVLRKTCDSLDVSMAQVVGLEEALSIGVENLPALVYFEDGIPNVYVGDIRNSAEAEEWLSEQRTADTVEKVTEEILQYLSVTLEYLAVFFTGPCHEKAKTDQQCRHVLNQLEKIDDELDAYGIALVATEDVKYAGAQLKIRRFPTLGIFRNGEFLAYDGPLEDEHDLLMWLVDKETLESAGLIEQVGKAMLKVLISEEENILVLFHDEWVKEVKDLVDRFHTMNVRLEKEGFTFVMCDHPNIAADEFGLTQGDEPLLVMFHNKVPTVFPANGDIRDPSEVDLWAHEIIESSESPTIELSVLAKIKENIEDILVIFFDPQKKRHVDFVTELDAFDDEGADTSSVSKVRVNCLRATRTMGLARLPAVVHFEHGVPNVYVGEMQPDDIFHWLREQRSSSGGIVRVTGPMLAALAESEEFVAGVFTSDCNNDDDEDEECAEALRPVLTLSERIADIGVLVAHTSDQDFIGKLNLAAVPSLGLYRNGDLLLFDGPLDSEFTAFRFLTNLDNLLLDGQIEEVGVKMLQHLVSETKKLFVFLYHFDDGRAHKIIRKLDGINDNLENDKTLLVKCSQEGVEDFFGVGYLPRLVFLEGNVPLPFTGDLSDEGSMLRWMAEVQASTDIRPVTEAVLQIITEKVDRVGVVFTGEKEGENGHNLLQELADLHDVLEEEDIVVVRIDAEDYNSELGLEGRLPAIVHYSGGIPSIFKADEEVTGDQVVARLIRMKEETLMEEVTADIMDWLIYDKEYLGVFFAGACTDDWCHAIEQQLNEIKDDLAAVGIGLVEVDDVDYPFNKHEIEKLPALGLYRNGHFLRYEGPLEVEGEEVEKWFLDEETLKIEGVVEDVNAALLAHLYEADDNMVVLFFDSSDRDIDEIIESLETIDEKLDRLNMTLVKTDDAGAGEQFGLTDLPALVYIQSGVPKIFPGGSSLLTDPKRVLKWLKAEANATRVHLVSDVVMERLVDKFDYLAAVFYKEETDVAPLQTIAGQCLAASIAIVKLRDEEEAEKFGLDSESLPQIVYFQHGVPSLVMAPATSPSAVLEWLLKHKRHATIEEVTDRMLESLMRHYEYVAVFFRGDQCKASVQDAGESEDGTDEDGEADLAEFKIDCDHVLAELEAIDDELDDIGILIVTTKDIKIAEEHGIVKFPTLGMFRNGHYVQYDGDQDNQKEMLRWMTDEETLKIIGIIDEVNLAMLENILQEERDTFVFFYDSRDASAHTILEELESIDEKLDQQDLTMVKISDTGAKESFGLGPVPPALVYFERGVPELYGGDLLNDNAIMKWMKAELKQEEIKEVTVPMLEKLVERGKTMAVLFYDSEDDVGASVLRSLEHIDDDCARFEISLLKVNDAAKAASLGIHSTPGLLYFENRLPSLYDGDDLTDEERLLDWLIGQKVTDSVEMVTSEILASLAATERHLAVYLSGPCQDDDEDECAKLLHTTMSWIDVRLRELGVMLVTTEEREWAKQQLEVRTFPAVGLFRDGDFALFEGDLADEMSLLEWLTDWRTLKSDTAAIVGVSANLLDYLVESETDVVAFIYREGNLNDKVTLDGLERIADQLSEKRVEFVECRETFAEKRYGLGVVPALVHFRHGIPLLFAGELDDALSWVMNNMKEDWAEEVTSAIFDVLVKKHDNLAVVLTDSSGDRSSVDLHTVNAECERNSITLVQVRDRSKAVQIGINQLPALVYFKSGVPGQFVGNMSDHEEVLDWILAQKKTQTIPLVTDSLLEHIVDVFDYVAAYFPLSCKEGDEVCLENKQAGDDGMEEIADALGEIGIVLVRGRDRALAVREYNVTEFPSLLLFCNGAVVTTAPSSDNRPAPPPPSDPAAMLHWLSDPRTLEVSGFIERVNAATLRHRVDAEDALLVFFCDEHDRSTEMMLQEMETVDDNLESEAVGFVRCPDRRVLDEYGLRAWPALVLFERGVPLSYRGDLRNDDAMLGWVTKELREEYLPMIKSPSVLDSLLDRLEFVAVLYYQDVGDPLTEAVLSDMRLVADEARMHDIVFVTVSESKLIARSLGPDQPLPALVYYENNIPFLYSQGNLRNRKAVLTWMVHQRNVASIEEVRDVMLDEIIAENEFVAVLYMGLCDDEDEDAETSVCQRTLDALEQIDSRLDAFGVVLVRTPDTARARYEHWLSKFPAIAYYRNGEYLRFNGNPADGRAVFRWLTSDRTLNLPGKIVRVNALMLSKLAARTKSLFVFFYRRGDVFAERVLRGLEEAEDDLATGSSGNAIDFVKVCEGEDEWGVEWLPALGAFKGDGKLTLFFGDLRQRDQIAHWMEDMTKKK